MINLRPYQLDSISLLREGFKKYKRQLLVLPTGSGKSVVFSEMCRRASEKGTQVLICTDRIELFTQTYKHIGNTQIEPQRINADSKMFSNAAPVSISMVETIHNRIKKGMMPGYSPKLLILDEAHKSSFFKIINAFPEALVIGCTATPKNKKLHLYYENIVANIDIPELISQGFLAPCRAFQMQDNFDDVKVTKGDFDEASLFQHFNTKKLYAGAIEKWKEKCDGTKTLVFCVNIEHAQKTKDEFNSAGVHAECVTSKTPKEERRRILSAFTAGHFPVLVNCGILVAGYDEPSIKTIIVYRATLSLTLWLQMQGRGSRPFPGKENFTVLDFGCNHDRLGLWCEEREWTLEPPRAKKKKGPAPVKNCPKCSAMLAASSMKCEFCGHEFERKTHEEKNGVLVEITSGVPSDVLGKRISEMTVPELFTLNKVKKYKATYIWRVLRGRGEVAIVEYANLCGYKHGWIQGQLQKMDDAGFKDYIIK